MLPCRRPLENSVTRISQKRFVVFCTQRYRHTIDNNKIFKGETCLLKSIRGIPLQHSDTDKEAELHHYSLL